MLFTRLISRRAHFTNKYVGKFLLMVDEKIYQVIKDLEVDPQQNEDKSFAVFKVHFKFSGLSLAVNPTSAF